MNEKIILKPGIDGEEAAWGGKGRALVRLMRAGFAIPEFFAIAPQAYSQTVGDELREEIAQAVKEIAPGGERLAVRSSADDEDGPAHSFAGQLESFLYVQPKDVAEAVAKVWKSGFSQRVRSYRRERGLAGEPKAPTVIVQRMVNAGAAGVAFSADPVSGDRDVVVVSAVWGVASALVSGEVDGDTWHVGRDASAPIVKRYIANKKTAQRASGRASVSPSMARQPALSDKNVLEVAELARRCERHFGRPQDIEWAMEPGRIYLLQSRAITTIASAAADERETAETPRRKDAEEEKIEVESAAQTVEIEKPRREGETTEVTESTERMQSAAAETVQSAAAETVQRAGAEAVSDEGETAGTAESGDDAEKTERAETAVEPERSEREEIAIEPQRHERVELAIEPEQHERAEAAIEPQRSERAEIAIEPQRQEVAETAESGGVYQLWDNSNIAESYGGVTTPMTFSFARRAYDAVYREFCRMLGVSAAVIEANEEIFPRMLGMIQGRVYYNLLNWYRLLAMLPGYRFNRRFMEQMMGVKEALPEEISAQIAGATEQVGRGQKAGDALRLGWSMARIAVSHFTLRRQIKGFYWRLNEALGSSSASAWLAGLRADQLVAEYRGLEKRLLKRWDAPLLNDFYAMIFYGSLKKFCEKWCGQGTLANDLLAGEGGMVSAEPAKRLMTMAQIVRGDEKFAELLRSGGAEELQRAIAQRPSFAAEYEAYLEKFADRCLEELKLESPTLEDDPTVLLRSVGQLALAEMEHDKAHGPGTVRAVAELCVRERLRRKPIRRGFFNWILKHARGRVRDRENLRFERTRIFGRVRRIVLELGKRLAAAGVLADAREVFYLELEEVLGFVEGTATSTDLRGLAAVRKAEFARHQKAAAPPSRFATRGMVNLQSAREQQGAAASDAPSGEERQGIACCAGKVRGKVCVVRNPRGARLPQGRILVAERTDPGWIMLFPSASGLLVERGSLLSHSAIVSRELGIPSIVSIAGLMEWLEDGDEVEMDGGSGVVRRVGKGEGN